jgi:GT2 family glycosyltransferase
MKDPKVFIITLNWNGYEDTIECIDSLKKATYPNFEILVIDNGSSRGDVKIISEKYGDSIHMIVNDENLGFPEGCNMGMKYSFDKGADYVLLLNNDTTVDPEFLTELVKVSETDSAVGMASSMIYYYYHPNVIQTAGCKINWFTGNIKVYGNEVDKGQYNKIIERNFMYGTSMLIKKSVIDTISFMDPYYFFGPEEIDYCTRAYRAGFKLVVVPESKIWHKVGASRAKVPQYPDTQRKLLEKSGGSRQYKYYYQLFKDYGTPGLYLFSFACLVLRTSLLGEFFGLLFKGDFNTILSGVQKRLQKITGNS